ncbi:tropomodulin, putative [Ixodes scapularis]|uniref:Tropomodulin, putative n=1 Tax=Ixodes scapularis TaxID=6945 RepID=B7PL84_IXOSC|nr:tropomodulin, putative [Ixodes scapularis]|eukprot:XP_002434532.1 tropomodulin, putative [Ixodes scapularis]
MELLMAGRPDRKVFVPRIQPKPKQDDDVEVELDIGEDYEKALNTANESELVDLAGKDQGLDLNRLIEAVRQNKTLKSLNVESNYISGPTLKDLVAATNVTQTLEELRASNQVRKAAAVPTQSLMSSSQFAHI